MLAYKYLPQADMIEIEVKCVVCGAIKKIQVSEKHFMKWHKHGVAIQYAMPELPAEDREMLMSQICGTCFDEVFADD